METTGHWNQKMADVATGAIDPNTFAGFDFAKCGAGAEALGIAEDGAASGKRVELVTVGFASLIAGSGGWSEGDDLTSDANGAGVTASAGDEVNAKALSNVAEGQVGLVLRIEKGSEPQLYPNGASALNGTANVDVTVAGATSGSLFLVTHLVTAAGVVTITPGSGKFTIVSASADDKGAFVWAQVA